MGITYVNELTFDELQADIEDKIPEALNAGLEVIRAVAVSRAPKDTGHMAGATEIVVDGNQGSLSFTAIYARYQEFGVFYRHGRVGAPLTHNNGQSFYLTTSMVTASSDALEAVASVLGGL